MSQHVHAPVKMGKPFVDGPRECCGRTFARFADWEQHYKRKHAPRIVGPLIKFNTPASDGIGMGILALLGMARGRFRNRRSK